MKKQIFYGEFEAPNRYSYLLFNHDPHLFDAGTRILFLRGS